MSILGAYLLVDIFVAMLIVCALISAKRKEDGQPVPIHVATFGLLIFMLWPIAIVIVGITYLLAPRWIEDEETEK